MAHAHLPEQAALTVPLYYIIIKQHKTRQMAYAHLPEHAALTVPLAAPTLGRGHAGPGLRRGLFPHLRVDDLSAYETAAK